MPLAKDQHILSQCYFLSALAYDPRHTNNHVRKFCGRSIRPVDGGIIVGQKIRLLKKDISKPIEHLKFYNGSHLILGVKYLQHSVFGTCGCDNVGHKK